MGGAQWCGHRCGAWLAEVGGAQWCGHRCRAHCAFSSDSTDVFICTSPIKMIKYCPYEKVRSPSQARAAVWHKAPSWCALPLSTSLRLCLSHGLDGLVTTWAWWDWYLPRLSAVPGPGKSGKAGDRDQGGARRSGISVHEQSLFIYFHTLSCGTGPGTQSITHARQVLCHSTSSSGLREKSDQELVMVGQPVTPTLGRLRKGD